jgi:hypothetical protein
MKIKGTGLVVLNVLAMASLLPAQDGVAEVVELSAFRFRGHLHGTSGSGIPVE